MNDSERRRYEALVRVKQFGSDNAGDFSGIATTKFNELTVIVDEIDTASSLKEAGFGESAQQVEIKATARENLRELMSDISRTAKSMEYAIDGISDKFLFRGIADANLLAKARAFVDEIVPYKADFIAYGLPATFDVALNTAADALEATFGAVDSATAEHISGTATVASRVRDGMIIVRVLDGIAKNVLGSDPGKYAAWVAAAHVQKAPSSPTPPTPPPPPTP